MKTRSATYNAIMNTLLTASNLIVALITIPYVSRVLSVERLGDVSFAQSVSTWASALCLLGVNVYGMRECARVRDDARELARVVKELLVIITATTSVVVIGFAVAIFVVPSFASVAPLMWMFLVGTLMLSYGVEWFYQGIEQYSYITVRSLAFKMLAFAATLLFVRRPGDYLVYGAILALVTCGNNLFNLIRLHKLLDFKSVGRLDVRRHIRPLMVFGAQVIAQSVYLSFNSTMLGVLSHGNYQVGLHQLAVKIEGVEYAALTAVIGVFVPRMAHDQTIGDGAEFGKLVRTGFGFTMNICLAVMCYLLVFAEPVVLFVSGEAFAGAVTPVRIIGAVSLMSCVSYFVAMCILSPLGRERQMAMSSIAAAPVSVVLNLLLDGPFGAVGAGVALLATEATVLCIELWCARDHGSDGLQRRSHYRRNGPPRRHCPHACQKDLCGFAAWVGRSSVRCFRVMRGALTCARTLCPFRAIWSRWLSTHGEIVPSGSEGLWPWVGVAQAARFACSVLRAKAME